MTEDVGASDQLLIRCADAGATYLSWTWLRPPFTPNATQLNPVHLAAGLDLLDHALHPITGEKTPDAIGRALTAGAFGDRTVERRMAATLTRAVLPEALLKELRQHGRSGRQLVVRVTPSPQLARIPWELLIVDGDDLRLIEIASVRYDPPATVHAQRSVPAPRWSDVRGLPALFALDPRLPLRAADHGLSQTLSSEAKKRFAARIELLADSGRARYAEDETFWPIGRDVTRNLLHRALTAVPRSRFFYFGHVSAARDEPGSASIHLSETMSSVWGMAAPLTRIAADGTPASPHPDDHRPFSALDLLLGTSQSQDPVAWRQFGADASALGHQLWPMPARVALIACEGGVDYRSAETFGLVMAIIDSGAELVTTTRWTLPSDEVFVGAPTDTGSPATPTTDLALAVDSAHETDDPIIELAVWQRQQLERWRRTGAPAHSPVIWASITHTLAPARSRTPDA